MKKVILGLCALVMTMGFAMAEGFWSAADLDKQTVTGKVALDKDAYIIGTSDKAMAVESCEPVSSADGETYNMRFSTKGAGTAATRSIHVNAKAGEKLTVYLLSSSKTDARVAVVKSAADDSVVAELEAPAYSATAGSPSVSVPANGEYYIVSKSGGIYIYAVALE